MRFLGLILVFLVGTIQTSAEINPTMRLVLLNTGLPLVEINTVDRVAPTCDYVSAPEGCWGTGAANKLKVPSRMTIRQGSNLLYDSGDYEEDQSGLTIAIRGNSSAYTEKKPYKLKLQKKADLLFRGDDKKYKDKNWLLLKDDRSMSLNTMIGLKVNELVGMQWTPRFMFVNVLLNDDYRGVYMLSESVRRNPDCRLDVEEATGYIMEYDAYWWNEPLSLAEGTFYQYAPMRYTFKYPDAEDMTQEQMAYIQNAVDQLERSVADGTYPLYVDLESFANWLLAHDILGTSDGGGSNIFLTKRDSTAASKFEMANLWDFDTIERTPGLWSSIHYLWGWYFKWMLESENHLFADVFYSRWEQLSATLVDDMNAFLDDFAASPEAVALDNALLLDGKRWQYENTTVDADVTAAKVWFAERKEWIDQQVEMEKAAVSIVPVRTTAAKSSKQRYDLWGRRYHGRSTFYIESGKKYFSLQK